MKNKNKTRGQVMVFVGFLMILVNALSYILNWKGKFVPIGIIGLVFVGVGLRITRGKF